MTTLQKIKQELNFKFWWLYVKYLIWKDEMFSKYINSKK